MMHNRMLQTIQYMLLNPYNRNANSQIALSNQNLLHKHEGHDKTLTAGYTHHKHCLDKHTSLRHFEQT